MLTGKQREIQQRDELFLEVARDLFLKKGYAGLTIGRIAQITRFSKGTIYQRFGSKNELIVELGIRCRIELLAMVQRAAGLDGCPRERMTAVGEAIRYYARLYPDNMRILAMIDAETILDRVPEEQRKRMQDYDVRVFGILRDIIDDAIAQGDLVLENDRPESVCFALWAMVDGGFAAMRGSAPLEEIGITDPMGEVARNGQRLVDGYGWRPLYNEWDYEETSRRTWATVFGADADVKLRRATA